MKSSKLLLPVIILLLTFGLSTCKYDNPPPNYAGYPPEIGSIITTRCALPGCHNAQSKYGAAGLDFTTWTTMFQGGNNGSSVIPYRADQSFLTYIINTYSDLGIQLQPTMPFDKTPLTHAQVATIINWVQSGAPNSNGFVWCSDNPQRPKFYVTDQGCDLVTVFDLQSNLPMRIITVGADPNQIEVPHAITVSPDNNHWYVCFFSGQFFQKFSASNDQLIAQVSLLNSSNPSPGSWNTMAFTPDQHYAFIVNWSSQGSIAVVDVQTMTLVTIYSGFVYPHGSTMTSDAKTLYVTCNSGNCIYKIDISNVGLPNPQKISLITGVAPNENSYDLQPHEVRISPDSTKYYVTCQNTNEVRVMNRANDSLLAVIPVGGYPQELVFSLKNPYLFVTCTNDSVTFPGSIGSVAIINYQTNTLVTSLFTGWQPHGINLDDDVNLVYVANRNATLNGPAPHHISDCGGRNGYVTIIDMGTLNLLPNYQIEVSVDPYAVGVRK